MLSHGNGQQRPGRCRSSGSTGDVRLSWLPLSHIFARTCDLYTWVCTLAWELGLAESRETLPGDLAAVRPRSNGVPYFFEGAAVPQRQQVDTPEMLQGFFGGRLQMACSGGRRCPIMSPVFITSAACGWCRATD